MSDLRKSKLVLKTSDLFMNNLAVPDCVVKGYIISSTSFVITSITSGTLTSGMLFTGSGVNSCVATSANTNGGVGIYNTTITQTPSLYSYNYLGNINTTTGLGVPSLSINQIYTVNATLTSGSNALLLGGTNTYTAIGQYVGATSMNSNVTIISGSGVNWVMSQNFAGTTGSTSVNFYNPPAVSITTGTLVTNAYTLPGTYITGIANSAGLTNNVAFYLNQPCSVTSETVICNNYFYINPVTINCYNLQDLTNNTPAGSCDKYRTKMTWNNINLRTLLGDIYDDYNDFNLSLTNINSSVPFGISSNNDNQILQLRMTGLPFKNNSYDQNTGHNTQSCIINTITFGNSAQNTNYYDNMTTFTKHQNLCNITLEYLRIDDGSSPSVNGSLPYLIPAVTIPYPNCSFQFDIYGVDNDSQNKKNGRRIY
jgi:hypothetical protein